MTLEKLTEQNMKKLAEKNIWCVGYSVPYLDELCQKYDVSDRISCIIDENARNHGRHILCGKTIEVAGRERFTRMNPAKQAILITSDYYVEEYEKLLETSGIQSEVEEVYYFTNKETAYEESYRDMYKEQPLADIIIFRSGPHAASYVKGMDFADNARALFDYMLANGYNETYELVWFVKNPAEFSGYSDVKNVQFLSFDWSVSEKKEERDRYYRALCLAKYIFFTDAYGFARNCRKDQIRVQLWHGCGFKTRVNFVRCEKRYEYTTVISEFYAKIHQDIYGLREDQMLVTGYAKQDWLFHPVDGWQEKLGIPKAGKYIFWLPTFRSAKEQLRNLNEYEPEGTTGLPVAGTYEMLGRLHLLLKRFDIVLVLKLHPFQDREKTGKIEMENIILLDNEELAKKDVQINRLLGYADALISDYSSAAVDYMLLDRPLAFTLDDVEAYEKSRGFVFGNIKEQLPGKEIYAFDDLCAFVQEIGEGVDSSREKRRKLTAVMHKYHDDKSCQRIAETLSI